MSGSDSEIPGYETEGRLGRGGYGRIYAVRDTKTNEVWALKTESVTSGNQSLANEIRVMKFLPRASCFPYIKDDGQIQNLRYFVMPLYGPSLSKLLREVNETKKFSLECAIKSAYEMIVILELLHESGIVHCDVKPGNFLLNKVKEGGFVLTDYGLSSFWIDLTTREHIQDKKGSGFRGTTRYASPNVHMGWEPTRRDDVISWFYSLIELVKGKLPWKDVKDNGLALSCKQSMNPEKLFAGLSERIGNIWSAIKDLKFNEKPDYNLIKDELLMIIREAGSKSEEVVYDWETQPWLIQKIAMYPELFCREMAHKKDKKKKKLMKTSLKKKCEIA